MTMTSQPDLTLTADRVINAPPEAVFDAWLDPQMLMRFMCPGPGMTTPQATCDARVGGRFDLIMKNGDDEMPHGGVYQVIDRPGRLVFSWESPFSAPGSTVDLTFEPANGGTKVTLTHTRFVSDESRDNHLGGWTAILEKLGGSV